MKTSNEDLVSQIQNTDDKQERQQLLGVLYKNNYRFIANVANRYTKYAEFDDLMQESFFGLDAAVKMYDADYNARFFTYASYWIRQAMIKFIWNGGSILRVPSHRTEAAISYKKVRNAYLMEFGHEPSDDELMKLLNIDKRQLKRIKEDRAFKVRSLDEAISKEDESLTLGDTIPDERDYIMDFISIEDSNALALILWDEVDALDQKQAEVIHRRYQHDQTLEEVGKSMNLSAERIRCIQANAIGRLRQSQMIRLYAEEYRARAFRGTGLSAFRNTGTSSTERTAIEAYEKSYNSRKREIDASIRKIEKKYNITLDEEYRQMKYDQCKQELESLYGVKGKA